MLPDQQFPARVGVRRGWRRRRLLRDTSLVALAPVLAGCAAAPAPPPRHRPDRVTLVTDTHDPDRWADWFADTEIDVLVTPAADPYQRLATGTAQFGIVEATEAYRRYINDGDEGFQIIATLEPETTVGLATFADSGIAGPADLPGRTVGLATGSTAELLWLPYLDLAGLNRDTVTVVTTGRDSLEAELIAGTVDAAGMPANTIAAGNGRELVGLPYAEVILDLYGAVLIASRQLLREDPELAARFAERADRIDEPRVVRGVAFLVAAGVIRGDANHALAPVAGDASDGLVNYGFAGATVSRPR